MYHDLDDKKFLHRMRALSGKIMQEFCHILKKEYDIGANFYLVGSGARNLILQNASEPVDLDYNLEIVRCKDIKDGRAIKECARKAFNKALNNYGWSDCEDSTSSLTTEKRHFTQGNPTEFSIDVCIVFTDENGNLRRLIHNKTGFTSLDRYDWIMAPNSQMIRNKAEHIKANGKWDLVRNQYKDIKNRYLHYNDHNHPSFICYIEAVNNVYNQISNSNELKYMDVRSLWEINANN